MEVFMRMRNVSRIVSTRKVQKIELNCSLRAIDDYPKFFTEEPPRYDLIVVCLILGLYCVLGIAELITEYGFPALMYKSLSNSGSNILAFGFTRDVSGAVLIAGASSAPEIFINLYATLFTEGDLGIGTIIGSSVFNILAIPAMCGFLSGPMVRKTVFISSSQGIAMDWWPITREILLYSFSVGALTGFLLSGTIEWTEALILLIIFIMYLVWLLFFNRLAVNRCRRTDRECACSCFRVEATVIEDEGKIREYKTDMPFNFFQWPTGKLYVKFNWILTYPFHLAFFFTIPNCKRRLTRRWLLLSFIMFVIWIVTLMYVITWTATVIGFHLDIPDVIMNMTLLAAAVSVPELLFCRTVVRKEALYVNTAVLFLATFIFYISLMGSRFYLTTTLGVICFFWYCSYVIIIATIHMNIFSPSSLPKCTLGWE
uniref:Sodium/calcium exchanger membrane region domain-containing protein n=1 Tax=Glossina morsitans morsitans TaxID=37546 RepID=A0A1B0FJC9_GLOMM